MAYIAKLSSKARITIPAEVCRQLGVGPGDRVIVEVEEGRATFRPVRDTFTEWMEGLGKDLWKSVGGGRTWLARERDAWVRDERAASGGGSAATCPDDAAPAPRTAPTSRRERAHGR